MRNVPTSNPHASTDQMISQERILLPAISRELARLDLARPSIFDAGCGDGLFAKWLQEQYPDCTMSVGEIDEQALDEARFRIGAGAQCAAVDLAAPFPYESQSFDLITSINVLMWLSDKGVKNAFREIARVLSDKGTALIVDVHSDWMELRYEPIGDTLTPPFPVGATWNNKPQTIWRRPVDHYLNLFKEVGIKATAQDIPIPLGLNLPARYEERIGTNLYAMFLFHRED